MGPRRGCSCWAVAFSPLLSAAGPCFDPELGGVADEGGPLHSEEGGEPNPGERGGGARASSRDVRTELGSLGGGRVGLAQAQGRVLCCYTVSTGQCRLERPRRA